MALSKYTEGNFSNYTSYTSYTPTIPISYSIPPTRPRRSALKSSSARLTRGSERRIRETETNLGLALEGRAVIAYGRDRDEIKRKTKKNKSKKRREVEEGNSWQPVEEVEAHCGANVTLPCRAPKPDSVNGLEWTRTDLDQYIYLFKDGEPDLTEQHEAYRGRCELKDGTAALVLQNVTSADSATYECRFTDQSSDVSKRSIIDSDPVSMVQLWVTQTGVFTGAEEKDDEVKVGGGDDGEGPGQKDLPVAAQRHRYMMFGVLGVWGLVAVISALVFW